MISILGTGQVGQAVFEQLQTIKSQQEILLVNRTGKIAFDLPPGTRLLGIDVTKPENLIEIFQQSEVVFSCTDVPYQFWRVFYPLLSNAMVEGLKHSEAKLVFADNMYAYGNLRGKLMHEELNHSAQTEKGKIRAALLERFKQQGVNRRVAIVKSSDFIGPRIEKGVFGIDFLKSIYQNKTINLPGKVTLPHHFTFIEDFAKALVCVAFEPTAYDQVWHTPNAMAISQQEWINLFIKYTDLNIRYRSIPKFVINVIGMFNPFIKELKELSYQFEYPYLINAQKFISVFGDHSTSPDEIVKKTVQWYNSTKSAI
jgi:nucleoside-diphosphate-sugar epimerase